jgi:DNA-binding NarL/FixJ family response regulator
MSAKKKIGVLLVDDVDLFRTLFAEGLRCRPELSVSEAKSPEQALRRIKTCCPDTVLISVSMHDCSGLSLLQYIHRQFPDTALLAFSHRNQDRFYAERALCAGAAGYVSADDTVADLMQAIRTVAKGGVYLNRALQDEICASAGSAGKKESPFERLSHREFEVFCLTGHGYVPKRIAERLKVSVKTVETYRERIREKLNLLDGGELLLHASAYVRDQKPLPLSDG